MKKFISVIAAIALFCALALPTLQYKAKAGPFGKAGKWVDGGGTCKICIAHWWHNDCAVNSTDGCDEDPGIG